jgi:3-isopropylmalate/(R)-2-methylmalate dehydratase small subunit
VREQHISLPDGGRIRFQLEPFARHCLLEGVDQLGFLLQHAEAITRYEHQHEEHAA